MLFLAQKESQCLVFALRDLSQYHRADHPLHEYLHYFVAAHNARVTAALGELALMISRCRTN